MSINPLNPSPISRIDTGAIGPNQAHVPEKRGENNAVQASDATTSNASVANANRETPANPVQELPEIRQQVIDQAVAKLNSGFYQSPEVALQSANALLR